ncbi:hypothetical protein [Serratia entomophila]|uniref:hypothetical protein n=1 Tax=Serratia entomophila TaxID=42906 RepID=UPI002178AFD1|nr:hypothetical protein [Serratia entomophila]CAI0725845.1 Uncharacterised protein [Serratia entomophila]CAI1702615.1 Uncharacterised protein [Serratia entomophila]CAI2448505.1 Uncharacterised protein [Serratia entomophila]
MTRITTRQFVELIQGKNLSTAEISALTHEKHPGNSMTRSQICIRLKSMLRSPNVNMIRTGQGNKARYHLIGVNERFYELGEVNFRPAGKKTRPDKTLWHFNPVELRFCHMHKMFDQALASVRGSGQYH